MSGNKWVYETIAEDEDYNWIQVNEDDEGFKFFVIHLSHNSIQLMMPEEHLKGLYRLLRQVFEGSGERK